MVAKMRRIFRGLMVMKRLNLLLRPSPVSSRLVPVRVVEVNGNDFAVINGCFKGSN